MVDGEASSKRRANKYLARDQGVLAGAGFEACFGAAALAASCNDAGSDRRKFCHFRPAGLQGPVPLTGFRPEEVRALGAVPVATGNRRNQRGSSILPKMAQASRSPSLWRPEMPRMRILFVIRAGVSVPRARSQSPHRFGVAGVRGSRSAR
jgi:hypothetical protein